MPATPSPAPRRLTAQELRRTVFDVEIRPGRSVGMRRVSVLTLLFTNKIPMPLLGAFAKMQQGIAPADLYALPEQDRAEMVEVLRWYACAAVADPVLVMVDDGDPAHVPVTEALTVEELFTISNAEPPADVVEDPDAPVPVVTADDLARFPGRGARDEAGATAHAGQDVPPAAVSVGAPAVELVHG